MIVTLFVGRRTFSAPSFGPFHRGPYIWTCGGPRAWRSPRIRNNRPENSRLYL